MTNLLSIAFAALTMNTMVLQMEPDVLNPDYYTAWSPTSNTISGVAFMSAFTGKCIRLSWTRPAQPVVLQQSPDLHQWQDIRVVFKGSQAPTNWFVVPVGQAMFYRLRSAP